MPNAIWFDSGKPLSLYGRFDIISAAPDMIIETINNQTTRTDHTDNPQNQDPFIAANKALNELQPIEEHANSFPFVGGLMGFWSYNLLSDQIFQPANNLSTLQTTDLPQMRLGRYLWAVILNHATRSAHIVAHPQCPKSLIDEVVKRLAGQRPQDNGFSLLEPFTASSNKQQYLNAVDTIKNYIAAGDCYQVNFSQHFKAPFNGDIWQAYQLLRKALPSPFSAFMEWGDKAILSISPERFIKLSKGLVETKPIKGTLARGNTMEQDQRQAITLQNSEKDRAENLMIVDLLRNDLGKACEPGSIKVPKLFELESYQNVHHLVSTVTGKLHKESDALSLLKGCFPGGSITGAPKKRAMEIINELEPAQRGLYCGSLGYISVNGRMDSNIAIRTLVADAQQLHCWGGGGIVADSNPANEYQESLDKVQLLMDTLSQ